MKIRTERGQLWSLVLRMAKTCLGDFYPSTYWRAKSIVKHDRVLNGELLHPERR